MPRLGAISLIRIVTLRSMPHLIRTYVTFLSLLTVAQGNQVSVNKCCPQGKALDKISNECTTFSGSNSFVDIRGLNLTVPIHAPGRTIHIDIAITGVSKPKCASQFERHLLRSGKDRENETWLTIKGDLVTSRYGAEFDHSNFCVDHIESDEGDVVALMCNPCQGKQNCLNLCCPLGFAFTWDRGCFAHNEAIHWKPTFWAGQKRKSIQQRNKDYILAFPNKTSGGFQCPNGGALIPAETDLADWKLHINGKLQATYSHKLTDPDCKKNATCYETTTVIHETRDFCLAYGENPISNYYYKDYVFGEYEDDITDGELSSDTALDTPFVFGYGYCIKP